MKYISIVFLLVACSTASQVDKKETATQSESVVPKRSPTSPPLDKQSEGTRASMKGIKNSDNVPSFTRKELRKKYQAQNECTKKCIMSRQMEAIGHEAIEHQCREGCRKEHFIGQVGVVPDLEDPQEIKKAKPKESEGDR